jgi:hypothetical protein
MYGKMPYKNERGHPITMGGKADDDITPVLVTVQN